jgi:hypothetical protein
MWTVIFPHHQGRSPTHGYAATREDAMAAFAKKLATAVKESPGVCRGFKVMRTYTSRRTGGLFRLSVAFPRPRSTTPDSQLKLAPNPRHARHVSADLVYLTH